MQYLKPETCQLLQKLGIKSESGMWWSNARIGYMYEDLGCSYIEDLGKLELVDTPVGDNYDSGMRNEDELGKNEVVLIPAYSLPLLITSQEAMKAIFGDSENVKYINNDPKKTKVFLWQWEAQRFLDLLLQNKHDEAEQILTEAIKQKLGKHI